MARLSVANVSAIRTMKQILDEEDLREAVLDAGDASAQKKPASLPATEGSAMA